MASRLCKAAMLSRFKCLARRAKRTDLLQVATYHEAKVSCKRRRNKGGLLMAALKTSSIGCSDFLYCFLDLHEQVDSIITL